jgi:hypothetical protein
VYFLINSIASIPTYTFHGLYDRATNAVWLYNDALTAAGVLAPAPPRRRKTVSER